MTEYKSEREEKLLETLITLVTGIRDTEGIKKIKDSITAVISGTPDVNVTDRAARLLGIVYGDVGQLLQRSTRDLIVQLRSAGVEIDPRNIRYLTVLDQPKIQGDQNASVAQRPVTWDLFVQLRNAGVEIDPRNIIDISKVANVTKYLTPTSLGIGGTATLWTPASGKKARPKMVSVSVDAKTRIDLRWGTTAFESHYLPENGNIIFNLIGSNDEGAVDVSLTLLSSAAATVTATARGDEV